MFETAVLSYGPPTKRVWATFAGFTGQVVLIGFALLAPMIWPQTIPHVVWASMTLVPPSPPPPPPPPRETAAPRPTRVVPFQQDFTGLRAPRTIPSHVLELVEEPEVAAARGGADGVVGGMKGGVPGGVMDSIISQVTRAVPLPKLPEPVVRETAAATAAPKPVPQPPRISVLQMAKPIYRVEPVYPALARTARISGTVELIGVLGVDGRIHELRVVRGHALLLEAAMTAVKQWVYAPTILNGQPVEVQAPILVNFILNH